MVYMSWMIVALLALSGLTLMLFVPGVGVLAALALAAAVVVALLLLVRQGAVGHRPGSHSRRRTRAR